MTSNLPDVRSTELASLGGQAALFENADQLLALTDAQLRHLAAVVGEDAQSGLAQMRRRFGLLAWAGWLRFEGKPYEEYVAALARYVGVNPRTVKSWRDSVVEKDTLAVPPATDQRKREATEREESRRSEPVRAGKQHGISAPIPTTSTEASAKKSEGGGRNGETRSAPLDEPPSDPSSRGAGIQRPQPPTGALLAPLSASLDAPGSPDPAFQRPLNPPELVGLSDADGLRWMNSRTPQQWRAVGDPYGPGIRAAVRTMGEAFGIRSPGRVIPPGEREAKADAIGGKADPATCKHPKQSRQVLGYMVKCGLCDTKVA